MTDIRRGAKERGRKTFTVPAVVGNYAEERITFGAPTVGQADQAISEITALAEGPIVAGSTVELWLRKVSDGSEAASAMDDADYTLAGTNFTTLTAAGAVRWLLTGWPGAQIRVKSGGPGGSMVVSATAF